MLLKSTFYTIKIQLKPVFSTQYFTLGLTGNIKLWQQWRLQVAVTPQIGHHPLSRAQDTQPHYHTGTPHTIHIYDNKDSWFQGTGDTERLFFFCYILALPLPVMAVFIAN